MKSENSMNCVYTGAVMHMPMIAFLCSNTVFLHNTHYNLCTWYSLSVLMFLGSIFPNKTMQVAPLLFSFYCCMIADFPDSLRY